MKNIIKRTVALVMALFILIAALSGCKADGGGEDPSGQKGSSNTEQQGGSSSSGSGSVGKSGNKTAAGTPGEAYSKYLEVKSSCYDSISEKLDEMEDGWTYSMSLLSVVLVDLTLIPLTVIGMESAETSLGAAMSILGASGVKYEKNGSEYVISYDDGEDRTVKQTCEYDASSDSMKSLVTMDGQTSMIFEYVKTGDGYASQYYFSNEDSGDYSLVTCYFVENGIAAFGFLTTEKEPDSIFKKTGLTSQFAVNDQSYFMLEDGKLTILEEGETKTY